MSFYRDWIEYMNGYEKGLNWIFKGTLVTCIISLILLIIGIVGMVKKVQLAIVMIIGAIVLLALCHAIVAFTIKNYDS